MDWNRIKFLGVAGVGLGVLCYLSYDYEVPGIAISGGAIFWGLIEGKLDKLFSKKEGAGIISGILGKLGSGNKEQAKIELLKSRIEYLETKTELLEYKLSK